MFYFSSDRDCISTVGQFLITWLKSQKLSHSKHVICATEKCNIHHGKCNIHREKCNIHHAKCNIHHGKCNIHHGKCNIHHGKCNIHQMMTQFQNHASNTSIGKRNALQTAVMVLIEHSQHIGNQMKWDAIFQMSIISPQLFTHFRIISFTEQLFLLM